MKKLVTAFAACMIAGLVSASVESQNIVGYKTSSSLDGVWAQPIQFVKVGGGATLLTDILDGNSVSPYDDTLQIYDAVTGSFVDYQWDGTTWFNTITDEQVEVPVVPGNSFLVVTAGTWTFAGEVASITTYTNQLNTTDGVTFVGNAFPADTTIANFDWSAMAQYEDTLQMYDAVTGSFVDYQWNGDQWFNTITDELLPSDTLLNEGFLLVTAQETLVQSFSVVP